MNLLAKIFILVLAGFLTCISGCNGNHCITVGGVYEGIEGEITYCYDSSNSTPDAPALKSDKGKTAYILTEYQVEQVNAKLEQLEPKTAETESNVKVAEPAQPAIKKFLSKIAKPKTP